uniref:Uncharacterized protein n=1 Tax=viral metagenome TaxID=1070528 RepID=A0A6M3L4J2_9ZZZZ
MPGVTAGVYTGSLDAGTEVSSTYEGRHLTVYENELIHPYIADGFVNKGDPVVLCDAGVQTTYGHAVGVAFNSAAATSDLIAIDTEGIWNLTVYAEDDNGNAAIEIGDPLFIRAGGLPGAASADGTGDAEISKIRNLVTQVPFGYALGSVVAGGSGVIAVKVHWDPEEQQDEFITFQAAGTADNAKSFTITDAAVAASGMFNGINIAYNNSGAKTGTGTIDGLNIDMATTADVVYFYGIAVYSATIADKTMGQICGLSFYFEDQGNAVSAYTMIDVGRNCPHASLGRDTIIRVREHTTVQPLSSFLLLEGSNALGYMFEFADAAGAEDATVILDSATCDQTADYRIRVRLATAAVDRYIYLYPV